MGSGVRRRPEVRGGSRAGICALEPMEPRRLMSLAYYDSLLIEDMPGFPGGEPGQLAGASESGEFMWSAGAAEGATGDSPAFLIIDGEYRPWSDCPELGGSLVLDINSRGTVLGLDEAGGRMFTLDLGGGERSYLDEQIIDAPPAFYLGGVSALDLGDDGLLVLQDSLDDYRLGGTVWGLLDGEVRELWYSEYTVSHVFIEPGNTVYGTRYTVYDQFDPGNNEYEAVRWTPSDGVVVIAEQRSVYGANSRGDVLVTGRDASEVLLAGGGSRSIGGVWGGLLDIDDQGIAVALVDYAYYGYNDYHARVHDGQDALDLDARGGISGRPVTITDTGLIVMWSGVSRRLEPGDMVRARGGEVQVLVDGSGHTIISFANAMGARGSITMQRGEVDFGARSDGRYDPIEQEYVGLVVPRSGQAIRLVYSGGFAGLEAYESARDRYEAIWGGAESTVRPALFASRQGNGVIAHVKADGSLWITFEERLHWGREDHWLWLGRNNLTQNHLDYRGLETPRFVGALDAFTTTWGAMNIVGLDEAGQVHAVWWSPQLGSPKWTTSNLSELSGAPRLVGEVSGAATPWGGMQIHGTDERGHLISIWWSPRTGEWRATDLTAQLGGPTLRAGSLDLQAGKWGSISLVGTTDDGEVVSYWWSKRQGWEARSVIEYGEPPRLVGAPSYFVGRHGGQHIAGIDADGHVLDLYWRPNGEGWRWRDLTVLAGGVNRGPG